MANHQVLLVMLSLALFMCSTIPACLSARGVDVMRGEIKAGLNVCYKNPKSRYVDDIFCCSCDRKCIWSDIQQCLSDCARESNCAQTKPEELARPVSVVRG
ncbi:hypothetical protein GQ55_6G033600 [Panicum hallii var. hallii]|uniref:Embryo surrounding factor 1 brassicaceae domain-containing protein n=1 Tax=Panicum hallii var. hallii TaxID=1504633 RepID=A0A2T7D3I5_9POAL|nr:hypothetical protein GQ55_6G033600 [Panicum hallii var. hallii]